MSAAVYDLTIEQGTTYSKSIIVNNPDLTAFDLTNWSSRSMIRKKYSDPQETAEFSVTITDAAAGAITFSLTPTETAAIPAGMYVWDLEIYTEADADVKRLLKGVVIVDPEATK